ncbi:hypothetical protein ACKKBF_B33680 [Auxenochlorella protothecoides x Auxenochlorella symbiontica]
MAGFGFSMPDFAAGLSSLNDIGERFSKIREDIESTLDATLRGEVQDDSAASDEPEQGEEETSAVAETLPPVPDAAETASDPTEAVLEAAKAAEGHSTPGSDARSEGWSEDDDVGLQAAPLSPAHPSSSRDAPAAADGGPRPKQHERQEASDPDSPRQQSPQALSAGEAQPSSGNDAPADAPRVQKPDDIVESKGKAASLDERPAKAEHQQLSSAAATATPAGTTTAAEAAGSGQTSPSAAAPSRDPELDGNDDRSQEEESTQPNGEPSPAAALDRDDSKDATGDQGMAVQIQEDASVLSPLPKASDDGPSPAAEDLPMGPPAAELALLRETLRVREQQAEQAAIQMAHMASVIERLTQRNEELALKAAAVSQQDVEELERDFSARLAAAERKAYALTKERDMLRRSCEQTTALQDKLKEKDEMIQEVMAEGEKLSKKQLAQETTLRKLRQQNRELSGQVEDLGARLGAAQQAASEAGARVESALAELAAQREQHAAQLAADRATHAQALQEAHAAQAAAEQRAADAARTGAVQQLRGSETRAAALEESLAELRAEAEAQRMRWEEREELLSGEVTALQRRCAVAEARSADVEASLPSATRPLLHQLEAMQATAVSQAEAWAAAEREAAVRLEAALQAGRRAEEGRAAACAAADAAAREAGDLRAALEESLRDADEARARCEAAGRCAAEEATAAAAARADVAAAREALVTMEAAFAARASAAEARAREAIARAAELERRLEVAEEGAAARGASPASPAVSAGMPESPFAAAPAPPRSAGSREGSGSPADNAASLRRALADAEAMRDRLMEELVAAATAAELGRSAAAEAAALRGRLDALHARCETCLVLLGEKDERIEELVADLSDARALYRQQIEFMADRLAELQLKQRQ